MSLTRVIPIHGNLFDAGVALANPSAAPAKTAPRFSPTQPPDLILREFVELSALVQGDVRRRVLELIARRDALNKECAVLRAKILDEVERDLAKRWEDAKIACRNAQLEIDNAKGKIIELERDKDRKKNILAQAKANQAMAHNASVPRFAPASAEKKKKDAIIEADREVAKAEKSVAVLQEEINNLVHVTLPALDQKFRKLSAEERRICGMVTGQVFADEITGLPMLPEL